MICLTRRALGPFGSLGTRRTFGAWCSFSALGGFRPLVAILLAGVAARTITLRAIPTLVAIRTRLPLRSVLPFGAILTFRPLIPIRSVVTLRTIIALRPVVVGPLFVVAVELIVVAIVLIELVAALRTLFFETGPAFAKHAEIMVGELQIIFGLHAVAGELHVTGQALVFFKQLGGIAALPVILPIAFRPAADVLRPLSPTSAPAIALTIVDQIRLPSITEEASPWPLSR